jgi:BON domain
MAEPMFGAVSPIWSAIPAPGVTWFQAPMPGAGTVGITNAGITGASGAASIGSGIVSRMPTTNPLSGEPYGFSRAVLPAGTPSGFGAPMPMFGVADIPIGVTAPALVSAIAIRRGQPAGPTSDPEIEDFIYDALELLPGSNEVEVRCDGGRTSLMGTVTQKRLKRDIGEIAWAIPSINDVQNNITIAPRRRSRSQSREAEPAAVPGRKSA